MKGFKDSSGKFRPTGNSSGLTSKQILDKQIGMTMIHTGINSKQRRDIIKKLRNDYEKDNPKRLSRDDWRKIVASQPKIIKDQQQMRKYFPKIAGAGGFAFSDLDHYKNAEARLDKALEKLAKKYNYIPEGYTAYQPWHDHPTSKDA